ncbi:P-loop containing nucleoside triphosphate hydrolase protein [Rhizodiscina lignyota]|uniref:P-loop containing nucleoside triphosphate hydrolase protein n=1 Tax=Rhizodiscina lignyota TaxID=1504668 RepID=A0A9P4I703_9PEZI|nr:P-loop containing nucleoside triphosphate hydrolase protein [Rhizodiscina lignyota]
MVLAKSKNAVGLGNSLMNDRFGKGKNSNMHRGTAQSQGIQRTGVNGETYVTNAKKEAAWVKMRSVTEQAALDEFLSTAELAGTDFTAEKMNNVKIIHKDQKNPYLLSAAEERAKVRKHNANKKRLTVPRRPPWDEKTTPQELDERERQSLLEWRRGLAELQDNDDLLMTPFERNLEVWRQLWRVIERSDLVVQIVDARNPLLFRSEDLENYVKEVDSRKTNLLLVNKADMMTLEQRQAWADYFVEKNINFRFFSAELAREMNEARGLEDEEEVGSDGEGYIEADDVVEEVDIDEDPLARETEKLEVQEAEEDAEEWTSEEEVDPEPQPLSSSLSPTERTRILTTEELEELFLEHAPEIEGEDDSEARKTVIGLVGYPNVGKSSTINALIGAKKVSVSATPGKTKHFQTIHLSDEVILCDCPGLVFPNFATTKAELVCSGVLPIDQLREFTGPAGLVAQRIPKAFLEAVYGMTIRIRPLEEGGTGTPTAEELLRAYARARGFSTQGLGQPDESRAARYVLKDYVKGKLLFCHPPPTDPPIDAKYFNRDLYNESHLPLKRRVHSALDADSTINGSADSPSLMDPDTDVAPLPPAQGSKSAQLDKKFFGPQASAGHLKMPFQYQRQNTEQGRRQLSGRKERTMIALERNIDPNDVKMAMGGKKHFKGNKRKKDKVKSNDDD